MPGRNAATALAKRSLADFDETDDLLFVIIMYYKNVYCFLTQICVHRKLQAGLKMERNNKKS